MRELTNTVSLLPRIKNTAYSEEKSYCLLGKCSIKLFAREVQIVQKWSLRLLFSFYVVSQQKERIMHEKLEQVKRHLKKNKELYLVGSVSLLVGGMTGGVAMARRPEVQAVQKIIGPAWKPQQTIIQFVERSTQSKPLHKVGTLEYYDSISDCARKTGHSVAALSKHVNGRSSDVSGDVFEFATPK